MKTYEEILNKIFSSSIFKVVLGSRNSILIFNIIVVFLLSTVKVSAQSMQFITNDSFSENGNTVVNTKDQGITSQMISADVIKSTSSGYIYLRYFKYNGAVLSNTNFEGSITLGITSSESTDEMYSIRMSRYNGPIGPTGGGGSDFVRANVYNSQGQIIGGQNITLSSGSKLWVYKNSSGTLTFKFNTTTLATVTGANATYYRAVMRTSGEDIEFNYVESNFSIHNTYSFPEPSVTDTNKNWTSVKTYDVDGDLSSASVAYFDCLARPVQSQSKDILTNKNWASETMYDSQGRAALSTMSAPINSNLNFTFKNGFIRNGSNGNYTLSDLESNPESPATVGTATGTLGRYYSALNTDEPYQDITDRPYTRTIFDDLNPGKTRAVVGGNELNNTNAQSGTLQNKFPQGYSHTMPAAQELYYAFGKDYFPENRQGWFDAHGIDPVSVTGKMVTHRATKTVSIDAHGNESVVFTDLEGRVLAAARSGNLTNTAGSAPKYSVVSTIGPQGYIDVHIPKGITTSEVSRIGGNTGYTVWDLRTGDQVSVTSMTGGNIYRVEHSTTLTADKSIVSINTSNGALITKSGAKGIIYKVNYAEYALNYYDDAGNLKESVQPLGFKNTVITGGLDAATPAHTLRTTYNYNSLGQLLNTVSPDEGSANFVYRKDGQIRFSRNSKQLSEGKYSYTEYDYNARPIESGVKAGLMPSSDTSIATSGRSERTHTLYDEEDNTALNSALASLGPKYQRFVAGNVSKTWTSNPVTNTTWYSYDIYGRVEWMVQQMPDIGTKVIEYTYDPITGEVLEVYYYGTNENFKHKYTYNEVGQLITLQTSRNGGALKEQASYEYYETGALKRTTVAQDVQGIDYVYNINGALKSINHPSLEASRDPGGDNDDLFGMIIDYHDRDYLRTGNAITTTNSGSNRYDGNIKATRWGTEVAGQTTTQQRAYVYTYDHNRWLEEAVWGSASNDGSIAPSYGNQYKVSGIEYDANGNIEKLKRTKNLFYNGSSFSSAMDNFTYQYPANSNRLGWVDDSDVATQPSGDLEDQALGNYTYNAIGQLTRNAQNDNNYTYTASGLVKSVLDSGGDVGVEFVYDDRGHRVRKNRIEDANVAESTYYVRDASGQVMAIYNGDNTSNMEHPIYGASRLGISRASGDTYELTDHLGNVRVVVQDNNTSGGNLLGRTDYYPFGMPMPNLNVQGDYRYAYQGQEKDPETGKEAFELRLWDSRIGRWLTTDPAGQYSSPYLGMGNNPISRVDPDGGYDDTIYENASTGDTVNVNDGINKTLVVNDSQFQTAKLYGSIINNEYARGIGFSSEFISGYQDFFSGVNYFGSFGGAVEDYFSFNLTPRLPSSDGIASTPGGELGQWLTPGGGAKLGFATFGKFGSKGWNIASKVASRFKIFECTKCATSIVNNLQKAGIKGEILEFTVTDGPKVIGAQVGKDFVQISTNGFHKAVHVEGLVFDNIFTSGVPLEVWKKAIEIAPSAKASLKFIKF